MVCMGKKKRSKCNPQAFITLGGGSVCDATKVLALVDSNRPKDGEYTFEYLETLASHSDKKGMCVSVYRQLN